LHTGDTRGRYFFCTIFSIFFSPVIFLFDSCFNETVGKRL
jgi:hypothetical protein